MKKKVKSLAVLVLALSMVFTLAACGGGGSDGSAAADDEVYTLKVSCMMDAQHYTGESIQRAADAIEERTDGHVILDIYYSGELGDYSQIQEEVQMGTVDIAIQSTDVKYDDRFNISCLPYSTTSWDQWKKIWYPGGFGFNEMSTYFEEGGIKYLNAVALGFMGISVVDLKSNIEDIMNPDVQKSELIRVPAMDTYIAMGEAFGFKTTSIAYGDLYSALQTGVADGVIGASAVNTYDDFRDVVHYWVDARYMCETGATMMNLDKFNSLPKEYQDIIVEVFNEEAEACTEAAQAQEETVLDELEEYGIEVYVPTEEELAIMSKKMQDDVWPMYEDLVGADKLQELLDALAE